MTESGTTPWLGRLLAELRLDRDDTSPALLAATRRGAVIWANAPALRLFGAGDVEALGAILFRSGPAARSFAGRLARIGAQPQFERLLGARTWPPVTATCVAIAASDAEPLGLIRIEAPVAQLQGPCDAASADDAPAPPAENGLPTPGLPLGGRPIRVLWETDRDGIVTHVGPEADSLTGHGVLAVGDHAASRLRPHAPDLADRVDLALRESGSVASTRLSWPRQHEGAPILVDVGCTARPGGGGLRGFLLVHAPPLRDPGSPPVVEGGMPAEERPAPESGAPPAAATEAQAGTAEPDAQPSEAPPGGAVHSDPAATLQSRAMPSAEASAGGNVVHFPALRSAAVPAKFAEDMRPLPEPALPDTAPDSAAPRWSESPDSVTAALPDGLTADERDAFAHIAQVLGTRPAAPAGPLGEPAAPAPQVEPEPLLPDAARALFAAIPVGLLLRRGEQVEANPAFLTAVGDGSVEGFRTRFRDVGPATPESLTRVDGAKLAAMPSEVDIDGRPAQLLALSAQTSPRLASADPDEVLSVPAELLDAVTDGVVRLDATGTITAAGEKAAALFGREPKALVGRRLAELVSSEDAMNWQAPQSRRRVHLRAHTRTGDTLSLAAEIVPLDAGAFCVLVASRPAADPRDGDAALREAERTSALKSEFLAKVSHEIRTPLNAILGFAEVIRDERLGPVGNSRYLEYLRDIHASGTHVMSLVNDLLDLSRIEAGRMDLRLEAVDANAVVQSCVNTLQTQAARGRIIMRLSLAPHLPATLADERSLRQIVLNLLSNAVKFNEPGGQVIVSTAAVGGDAVAIRIRDTGVGMTDDEIAAAMEPFRQLSTVNRTGSGLGLPLTKALVEAHCASLAIKSTRGEGTLVEVTFPVVEPGTVSLPA